MREKYEQQLQDVQQRLIQLCELSIHAFDKSLGLLQSQDISKAWIIIEQDRFINRLEQQIQDDVQMIMTKQQPVATDLRRLLVIIRAASEMERIGDYAVSIAKETIRIGENQIVYDLQQLMVMRTLAVDMLQKMLQAFSEENLIEAKEIATLDDEIDQLYGDVLSGFEQERTWHEMHAAQLQSLSFICKYVERAADHATNLAEALFYLVQGKRYDFD
ncbi:phosphate signaling complex protein PhoU [Kurthia senegalensis]|uniref:phosphate signaling complex protein PhoU n=1 Tax=Kurthia senegalensis TaxID=1033740 RepID=UPI000289606F|nr:phosphate signaling complex protein PhoU [Kurthia senegalensis]